jgi:acyl-coenzyme A thioesterase PaaI-like protein
MSGRRALRRRSDGLQPIQPFRTLGSKLFVSDDTDPLRLRVAYFRRTSDGALIAKVTFGPGAEGPPNCAHGGSIAAALDEALGAAAWMQGDAVLAARLTVTFRRRLPLGTTATIEAKVHRRRGRKLYARGALFANGALVADARSLLVVVDRSMLRPRPSRQRRAAVRRR